MSRRSLRGNAEGSPTSETTVNALRSSLRSHSRQVSHDLVQDASTTGQEANEPVASTSNGHVATVEPPRPRKRQKTGEATPANITPDTECSFCEGNAEHNREGAPEEMISCTRCGSSGHFSCLHMQNPRLIDTVKSYDWKCMECKLCEVCSLDTDDLLFCDRCDRGWHGRCLTPPLAKAPKGSWICPRCRRSHIDKPPKNGYKVRLAIPTARPSSQIRTNSTQRFVNGVTLDSEEDVLRSVPPRNAVAGSIGTAKQNSPRQRQRQKGKQRDKGKQRALDVGVGDPAASAGPRIKLPNGFFGGASVPSAGNLRVRLKLPTSDGPVYEEQEEVLPYGGILQGEAAEAGDREPTKDDRARFNKARTLIEARLAAATAMDFIKARPALPKLASTSALPISQSMPDLSMPDSAGGYLRSRPPTVPVTPTATESVPGTPLPIPDGQFSNVKRIRFGDYEIETWYQAPYPEEYARVPDGRLWLCEFCLKYFKTSFQASRHRLKCQTRHPPGDEIYRDGNVSVFEVDGRKSKIYCQNLCLLAKMFLDHKTLYYDVDPFLFYVMTETDANGAQFVGYFSKEKRSPTNNVSCIMTLPVRQRRGWGNLLVDFSYLLSRKEGRVGTPEKPLSDLGLVTYRNYWILNVYRCILDLPADQAITIEEISRRTSITTEEVYYILRDRHLIHEGVSVPPSPVVDNEATSPVLLAPAKQRRHNNGRRSGRSGHDSDDDEIVVPTIYAIGVDRAALAAHVAAFNAKGYLTLRPERLKWTPFLTHRGAAGPPPIQDAVAASEAPLLDINAAIEVLEIPGQAEPVVVDNHGVEVVLPTHTPAPVEEGMEVDSKNASDEGEVPITPPAPVSTKKRKEGPSSRPSSLRKRRRDADAEVADILLPSRTPRRGVAAVTDNEEEEGDADGEGEDSGVAF